MNIVPVDLPTPIELGFASKFSAWQGDQIAAIDHVTQTAKRFAALTAPTGAGKSLIGYASALLHPDVKRAIYLTSTKGLQDQAFTDFQNLGVIDIRGQRNYPCRAVMSGEILAQFKHGRKYIGCDEGPCRVGVGCDYAPDRKDPRHRPECAYYADLHDARRADLVSTNYAMWLSAGAYTEGLGDFDLLILDEAHDADKELESFLTFDLSLEDTRVVQSKMLKTADPAVWRDWATHHRSRLNSQIELRELHPPSDPEGARDLRSMKAVLGKLDKLAHIDPLSWLVDLDPYRGRFAPTKVGTYAEQYLFRGVKHVLLMSATMTRKTTQLLGIPSSDLAFWECPSRFPIAHRPVISVNTQPGVVVNARMHEDDKFMWLRRIDRLIEPRRALGRKGIIHTVSYQRMKELLAASDHKDIMVVHDSSNTREMVAYFKQCEGPLILVSPSVVTGYDFPNEEVRYQIIGKVPIPDMRGPIMSIRQELDPDYSGYLAMQKLVQACGRGVRGPLDWCECVSPETRILTADLNWKAAADLTEGSRLLAFDEYADKHGSPHDPHFPVSMHRRKWRWSTVVKSRISTMPRMRVVLDDAELICTPNHPWLIHARNSKQGWARMQTWWRTDELTPGDKLLRLLKPWAAPASYEEGWLAGFADGEGCLVSGQGRRHRSLLRVLLSQNINCVATQAAGYLANLGFGVTYTFPRDNHTVMSVTGGVCEMLRFLGQIRPVRFMEKFAASERVEDLRRVSVSTVRAVERLPDGPISSLQTSTATYVAEGFGAHNTLIVDDGWANWFLERFRRHAPRWFLDGLQFVESFPEPMADPFEDSRSLGNPSTSTKGDA